MSSRLICKKMENLNNRTIIIAIIAAVCIFVGIIAAMGIFAADEWTLFYYTAFFMLGISILFNGFATVVSVAQLISIKYRNTNEEGAITFVLMQMLQSVVALAIAIPLLIYLREGTVAAWIIFAAVTLLSVLERAARLWRLKKFGREGRFG